MSFLNNPKLPLLLRYLQILIAIAFLVLLCWSSTHRFVSSPLPFHPTLPHPH
jgi:hypothetical protein